MWPRPGTSPLRRSRPPAATAAPPARLQTTLRFAAQPERAFATCPAARTTIHAANHRVRNGSVGERHYTAMRPARDGCATWLKPFSIGPRKTTSAPFIAFTAARHRVLHGLHRPPRPSEDEGQEAPRAPAVLGVRLAERRQQHAFLRADAGRAGDREQHDDGDRQEIADEVAAPVHTRIDPR